MTAKNTGDDQLLGIFLRQLGRESQRFPHHSAGPPCTEAELLPHARLVVRLARRYSPMAATQGLTTLDLIQEGYIGLMRAFKKFDPNRGIMFGTYATHWVRASITRVIDNGHHRGVRLPGGKREAIKNLNRSVEGMTQQLQRQPTLEEVIASESRHGVKANTVMRLIEDGGLRAVSMDGPIGDDDGHTLQDILPSSEKSPEDRVVLDWMMAWIRTYIDELEERTRTVIMQRFGLEGEEPCSLQQVADALKISRERVRQLERTGLARIKALMAADTLRLMAKRSTKANKSKLG